MMSILAIGLYTSHVSSTVNETAGRAKCALKYLPARDGLLLTVASCTIARPILKYSSIICISY